jgi:hypothetical protein
MAQSLIMSPANFLAAKKQRGGQIVMRVKR